MCQAQQQPKHHHRLVDHDDATSPALCRHFVVLLSLDGGDLAGGAIVVDNARAFTSKFGEGPIFCKISRALFVCFVGEYSEAYSYYYCYCRVVHLTIFKFRSPAAIVSLHYYGLLTRLLATRTSEGDCTCTT